MLLNSYERIWAPPGSPELWTVVPANWTGPMTLERALSLQARMGDLLVAEALEEVEGDEDALAVENDLLQESLQAQGAFGPESTPKWTDGGVPTRLLRASPLGPHREWRARLVEAVKKEQPLTRSQETVEAIRELDLRLWIEALRL